LKILDTIEIPILSSEPSDASAGYAKIFSKDGKIHIKGSAGASTALQSEIAFASSVETNPVYTYTSGNLTRIDYASGNYKVFTYTSGNLTRIDYVKGSSTFRKDFVYDLSDNLTQITYSLL
jgi:hypothetical protein